MNAPEPILHYLSKQIPDYPFDPKLDEAFVHELIDDFHDLDILEETRLSGGITTTGPPTDSRTSASA